MKFPFTIECRDDVELQTAIAFLIEHKFKHKSPIRGFVGNMKITVYSDKTYELVKLDYNRSLTFYTYVEEISKFIKSAKFKNNDFTR